MNSKRPTTTRENDLDVPSAMDVACSTGAVVGGIAALLLLVILIAVSVWLEKLRYGSVNWDCAVGIGFLPIIAIPVGVVLGTFVGMIYAAVKR